MKRRALLTSLVTGSAALARCAFASSPDDSPSTDTEPDNPTTDPGSTPTDRREGLDLPAGRASDIELETVPHTYSLVPTRLRLDDHRIALRFDRTATAEASGTPWQRWTPTSTGSWSGPTRVEPTGRWATTTSAGSDSGNRPTKRGEWMHRPEIGLAFVVASDFRERCRRHRRYGR